MCVLGEDFGPRQLMPCTAVPGRWALHAVGPLQMVPTQAWGPHVVSPAGPGPCARSLHPQLLRMGLFCPQNCVGAES